MTVEWISEEHKTFCAVMTDRQHSLDSIQRVLSDKNFMVCLLSADLPDEPILYPAIVSWFCRR